MVKTFSSQPLVPSPPHQPISTFFQWTIKTAKVPLLKALEVFLICLFKIYSTRFMRSHNCIHPEKYFRIIQIFINDFHFNFYLKQFKPSKGQQMPMFKLKDLYKQDTPKNFKVESHILVHQFCCFSFQKQGKHYQRETRVF